MGIGWALRCLRCGTTVQGFEVGQLVGCRCGNLRLEALESVPAGRTRIVAVDMAQAERVPVCVSCGDQWSPTADDIAAVRVACPSCREAHQARWNNWEPALLGFDLDATRREKRKLLAAEDEVEGKDG